MIDILPATETENAENKNYEVPLENNSNVVTDTETDVSVCLAIKNYVSPSSIQPLADNSWHIILIF